MSEPWTTEEQIAEYVGQAHGILAALDQYEETHPKDAPCFDLELIGMKQKLGVA